MTLTPSREERIVAARHGFVVRARGDAEELLQLFTEVLGGNHEAAQRTREIAHRLTGTAGSYGFVEVTSAAANVVMAIEIGAAQEELAMVVTRLCKEIMRMGRTEC